MIYRYFESTEERDPTSHTSPTSHTRVYILKGGALTLKERERAVILGSHSKTTNDYRRNHTQIINKTDKFPPITIFNHLLSQTCLISNFKTSLDS